jgi:predicted DNA-binding protein YlxM (UPF0122 family)
MSLSEENSLAGIVSAVGEKSGGIIISTGQYINEIPKEAIDICENLAIPLFRLKKGVCLSLALNVICNIITAAARRESELESALKHAIYFPEQTDLYRDVLIRNSLYDAGCYAVSVIAFDGELSLVHPKIEEIKGEAEDFLDSEKKIVAMVIENKLVMLFCGCSARFIEQQMARLFDFAGKLKTDGQELYAATGGTVGQIDMIGKSYRQAHEVLKLQKRTNSKVYAYDKLGIYKLLLAIDDKEAIKSFYREHLKPLVVYDEINNTDYVAVLRCYLDKGGSLKETAVELFVHRNTVNYKIHKIEEILGCNLADVDERLKYTVAFKIRDII